MKVVRHRVDIAGNKYAARFGRDSEDLRIGSAFRYDSCGRLKINCRFSSPEPTLDFRVQVGVGLKPETHARLDVNSFLPRSKRSRSSAGNGCCRLISS